MSEPATRPAQALTGRIGITLLCLYLLAVTVRIGGCYAPEPARRDELPDVGPAVGAEFPAFTLRDVSGTETSRDDLRGAEALIVVVPSLDWSPPTKARLLDLADVLAQRRGIRIAVVMTAAQATPRALAFVRDRHLPFYFLIDDAGLIDRLGLGAPAPDGSPAALPATFGLDAAGRVRFRDIRKHARSWLAAPLALDTAARNEGSTAP
jgi:peroxiredoxin